GRVHHQGAGDLRRLRPAGRPQPAARRLRRPVPRRRPGRLRAALARPLPPRAPAGDGAGAAGGVCVPWGERGERREPRERLEHGYGTNVHIPAAPRAPTQLARLCAKGTYQPEINTLVGVLYRDMLRAIINAEFPRRPTATPTRMIDATPMGVFHGETIDPEVRAVTVNIARAGTLPSQITYDFLNTILDPRLGPHGDF